MSFALNYKSFGELAILVAWPQEIKATIGLDVHQFNQKIQRLIPDFVIETVPAYCSLTLFTAQGVDKNSLIERLKLLYLEETKENEMLSKTWKIPVCYDISLALDLEKLAVQKKCSIEDIIKFHSETIYTVEFLGFLPGFPYLSGLNPFLHTPRLTQPRIKIAKGSVAIGGQQTGVYPVASPAGWHIIGSTPQELFNPHKDPVCLLKPMDKIKFESISLKQYTELSDD